VFVLAGGHWAVLQTVAWAGMLANYSQTDGLVGAVEKTFSGDHPCKLCVKVETGKKQEEQKLPLQKTEKKAEALVERCSFQFVRRLAPAAAWPRVVTDPMLSRRDAPPSPPPQALS